MNSKFFIAFEWIYRLVVINLFTLLFICLIFTGIPGIVASHATIKRGLNETSVLKEYFRNFKKYFWKSFFVGLILLVVMAIIIYAFCFYSYQEAQWQFDTIAFQMGIVVMIMFALVLALLCVHIPLIIITFPRLSVWEIYKTAFYVSFRYFLTTLILLSMLILEIIGVIAAPIWLLIGISLPMLLGIKFTAPVYMKFEMIDLEKIIKNVEEEEDEDE